MTGPHDPDGARPHDYSPDDTHGPDDSHGPDDYGPDGGPDPSDHTPDEEDATTEPDVTTSAPTDDDAASTPANDGTASTPADDDATPGDPLPPLSGLRNPIAAVRGVGAGALAIEAVILLLAIVPLRVLDVRHTSVAIGCLLGIVVLCVVLAGMMRREWAWKAGIAPPILVIACGYFHFSLAVIGVLFLLVWLYVLSVRRTVLGRRR
jgi:uncharacterized protein DUF4233